MALIVGSEYRSTLPPSASHRVPQGLELTFCVARGTIYTKPHTVGTDRSKDAYRPGELITLPRHEALRLLDAGALQFDPPNLPDPALSPPVGDNIHTLNAVPDSPGERWEASDNPAHIGHRVVQGPEYA
jgi:hypothetical protein